MLGEASLLVLELQPEEQASEEASHQLGTKRRGAGTCEGPRRHPSGAVPR